MVGFIFHHYDVIDNSRIGKLDSKPFSILEKYIRFFIFPFICLIILTGCTTKLEGSKFIVEEANFHQQYGYYTSSTGLKIIPIDVEISKADEIKLYNKVSSVREEYIQLKKNHLIPLEQHLLNSNSTFLDRFKVQDVKGNKYWVYFDISDFFTEY